MTSYASLRLTSVMMHQVVRSDVEANSFETVLTDVPVALDAQKVAYLVQRFQASLTNRAVPVIQRDSEPHTTRSSFLSYWRGDDDLVAASKKLADHLAQVQPGSAAEGLLVVADALIGSEATLLLAKVEHQEAMRLEPTKDENGASVFSVELISDLVFGDKTRIFKVAMFPASWSSTGMISGEAVDEQSYGSHIATYFLETFLGMRPREEPSVLTESMLSGFTRAINSSSLSDEQKLIAHNGLIAELQSNDKKVDPQAFVRKYIPDGHGSEVARLAADAGAPTVIFAKDLERIENRMRRVRIDLGRDITLVTPPDELAAGGSVALEDDHDGQSLRVRHVSLESIKPSAR